MPETGSSRRSGTPSPAGRLQSRAWTARASVSSSTSRGMGRIRRSETARRPAGRGGANQSPGAGDHTGLASESIRRGGIRLEFLDPHVAEHDGIVVSGEAEVARVRSLARVRGVRHELLHVGEIGVEG